MIEWLKDKVLPPAKRQWRVVSGVFRQAAVPVFISFCWAVFTTLSPGPWAWAKFVTTWGSALAVLSILASQWFRVSKQIRDRDDFGSIQTRMDSLHSLMEGLQQNRANAGQPPVVVLGHERHEGPVGPLLPHEHRLHTEMEPDDFFRQAWSLFESGQDYPAMWMAAMGYERVLREQSIRIGRTDGSLRRIVDGLPDKYIHSRLRRELLLLTSIRNNLAHPLAYPGAKSSFDDRVEPSSVIRWFEIASREVQNILMDAFPNATISPQPIAVGNH